MAGEQQFWAYIVANRKNGAIYGGHTDNLARRIWEHKTKAMDGFTKRYGCDQLVWCEPFETRDEAFRRERQLKTWRRTWKIELIEASNPTWRDLYDQIVS